MKRRLRKHVDSWRDWLHPEDMKRFLYGRISLVRKLKMECGDATDADLCLILCAIFSACSSARWPGKGIDKKRFIELLIQHSRDDHYASWISVPALANSGLVDDVEPGFAGCDDEIDLKLDQARGKYLQNSQITEKELRHHSYACLIYEWVRCGYAHEYCIRRPGSELPSPQTLGRNPRVSYIGTSDGGEDFYSVTFHLDYLVNLAEHHVSIFPNSPSQQPSKWWIEGG